MTIKPDYYDRFKCIANKCVHNCCIGWEIDIDSKTYKKYENTKGELGKKLRKSISPYPCAHFILEENDRCPFLNNDNLCELIISKGENMLCRICKDHPRFYNNIFGNTEKGIGLSCEEAARIILTNTDTVKLIPEKTNIPQNDFYMLRASIFEILQNRKEPLKNRISRLTEYSRSEFPIDKKDWISIYKNLERLDPVWDNYLDSISDFNDEVPKKLETAYEQLLVYFIYRHFAGVTEDFLITERIQFAILSFYMIKSANKSNSLNELIEIARIYSSEIEYSDQNISILLKELSECN